MHQKFEYMVGGLGSEAEPERETEVLNSTGKCGWKLVSTTVRRYKRSEFTFYYFRRRSQDRPFSDTQRFGFDLTVIKS